MRRLRIGSRLGANSAVSRRANAPTPPPHAVSTFPSDCRGCGACCFSPGEAYVRVTGADWGRLASDADRLAHFLGHRAFMRMQDGHCAALLIGRTDTGVRTFHCSIYDRRPAVCRELGRGSPECAAEIGRKSAGIAGAF